MYLYVCLGVDIHIDTQASLFHAYFQKAQRMQVVCLTNNNFKYSYFPLGIGSQREPRYELLKNKLFQ